MRRPSAEMVCAGPQPCAYPTSSVPMAPSLDETPATAVALNTASTRAPGTRPSSADAARDTDAASLRPPASSTMWLVAPREMRARHGGRDAGCAPWSAAAPRPARRAARPRDAPRTAPSAPGAASPVTSSVTAPRRDVARARPIDATTRPVCGGSTPRNAAVHSSVGSPMIVSAWPHGDHAALVHDGDPVGDHERLVLVVRDPDDGGVGVAHDARELLRRACA